MVLLFKILFMTADSRAEKKGENLHQASMQVYVLVNSQFENTCERTVSYICLEKK